MCSWLVTSAFKVATVPFVRRFRVPEDLYPANVYSCSLSCLRLFSKRRATALTQCVHRRATSRYRCVQGLPDGTSGLVVESHKNVPFYY